LTTFALLFLLACTGDKDTGSDTSGDGGTSDGGTSDGGTSDGGTSDGGGGDGGATTADAYAFESAFQPGVSSVSNDGQIMRHLLIDDLSTHLGGITARIDAGTFFPVAGDVKSELLFYFEFDSSTSGLVAPLKSTDPAPAQATYDEVSTGKNLKDKLAGNDSSTDHKDWSSEFVGWSDPGVSSPESLVLAWIDMIDAAAVDRANGNIPLDPTGAPLSAIYLTADGQDLNQLLNKFLRGGVAFSQGTDDYLDDDVDGKGLLADHSAADGDEAWTPLEHQWDEGFGYFGAARTYGSWSDELIADTAYEDVNGDGKIDLLSEVSWGHSTNAAKRDRGASKTAPMDLTAQAWDGFYLGRALLSSTAGTALTTAQLDELKGYRDQAEQAWELAIATTVVHYINDTLQDMGTIGTPDYSFADHAKHWSEGKGFALGLQFNPRSPLSDADFALVHELLGDAPVLTGSSELEAYAEDLREARAILGAAYGIDASNLGDDDGTNGL